MTRVVVVTGASRGIGEAVALAAAARRAALVLTARGAGRLQAVAAEARDAGAPMVTVVVGDMAEPATARHLIDAATKSHGGIDALVNNAGILEPLGPVAGTGFEDWQRHMAVNVVAPAALTALALPALRARRGRIVNVSSGAAVKATEGWAAYCAGKAALNQLNAVTAAEEPDVTCVAFSPGMTDTDMQALIRDRGPGRMPAQILERFLAAHREGELRSVGEVGAAIAALALEAPPEMSGTFVSIDDQRVRDLVP